jgi:hypothetical protein
MGDGRQAGIIQLGRPWNVAVEQSCAVSVAGAQEDAAARRIPNPAVTLSDMGGWGRTRAVPPLCVALARSTTVSCGVQIRYYMRVYQNAAGCRPSTCPALFRGRPPRPSVPGWPQSRRQVRLCAGLQAAASALCAVVAHGV